MVLDHRLGRYQTTTCTTSRPSTPTVAVTTTLLGDSTGLPRFLESGSNENNQSNNNNIDTINSAVATSPSTSTSASLSASSSLTGSCNSSTSFTSFLVSSSCSSSSCSCSCSYSCTSPSFPSSSFFSPSLPTATSSIVVSASTSSTSVPTTTSKQPKSEKSTKKIGNIPDTDAIISHTQDFVTYPSFPSFTTSSLSTAATINDSSTVNSSCLSSSPSCIPSTSLLPNPIITPRVAPPHKTSKTTASSFSPHPPVSQTIPQTGSPFSSSAFSGSTAAGSTTATTSFPTTGSLSHSSSSTPTFHGSPVTSAIETTVNIITAEVQQPPECCSTLKQYHYYHSHSPLPNPRNRRPDSLLLTEIQPLLLPSPHPQINCHLHPDHFPYLYKGLTTEQDQQHHQLHWTKGPDHYSTQDRSEQLHQNRYNLQQRPQQPPQQSQQQRRQQQQLHSTSSTQHSLDYLEFLEFCLDSNQDLPELAGQKHQRPRSWASVKSFVSHRLLGGLKKNKNKNKRYSNHSDFDSYLSSRDSSRASSPTPSSSRPLSYLQPPTVILTLPEGDNSDFSIRRPSSSSAGTWDHRLLQGNFSSPTVVDRALLSPSSTPSLSVSRSGPISLPSSHSSSSLSTLALSASSPRLFSQPPTLSPIPRRQYPTPGLESDRVPQQSTSVNSTHMRDWTEASFTNTRAAGSSRPTSPTSPTSSSISWDSTCIRSQTHLHSHQTYHTLPKHSTPPASPRAMTSSPTFTSTEPSSPTGQHSSKFSQLQARFESNTSLASTSSSVSFATHTQNQTKATASMTNHTSESLASLVSNSTAVTTSATIDAVCPPLQSTTTPSRRNSYRKPNGAQHPLAIVSTFDSDHEGSTSSLPNAATHNDSDDRTLWSSSPEPIERRSSLTKASPGTMAIDAAVHLEAKLALQEHMSRAGPSEPSSSDTQRMSQDDMSMLKDAVKSVAPRVFSLSIKSRESVSGAHHADQNLTSELEWTSLAVTSGGEQPLSPVTASHPTNTGHTLGFAFQDAQQQQQQQQQPQNGQGEESRDSSQPEDPPQTIENTNGPAEEPSRPTRSSPQPSKHFEIWTPPPPGQRPACFPERPSTPLRHPQGRLQRILKHRSFNFQFSNVPATSHEGSSTARASMDSNVPPRTGSASDNPRQQLYQVGPPDPIPPHYQHLQSRTSPAFRRRSHAGELDRFSPGWIVAEHNAAVAASNQSTPRVSVNEDRSSADMNARRHSHSVAGSRRVSLGVQTPAPSMWSRLLSSIFIGGPENNSSGTDSESDLFNMENRGPVAADPIVQQRLLLTPLSLQQNVHPLYQQQLFFYADEVEEGTSPQDLISRASQDVDTSSVDPRARSASEDSTYTATTTSCTISANGDNSSNVSLHPHFRSLANNANLQGELAQEDGRESLEMMNHDTSEPFLRPETPGGSTFGTSTGGDSDLTRPRSPLTVHNKIPVSSLALSSPPSYWEAAIKYKGWAKIEPRPEQGQEALPRYSCSVFREGCVNRKTELIGNWRPYRRPWKRSFAHLRGTALRLYAVDMDDVPRLHVRNISLQMARCEIATDYKQRPNVIRIRACDRTILMECKDRIDALTWLEHLQAAANIASSLEDRCMPKFYTLPRAAPQQSQQQQRRHTSATTTMSSHQHSGLGSPTSSGVSQHHQREQSAGHQQQQQPPRPLSPNSEEMAALDHQQLQRQLQEQQEHNLQRQIQEEMHNRALQRLVLSSEDSRVVSPSLSQSQAMSPTETSQNTSTSRRQSRNSLLTLAERERVLTESELNSETTTRQEDLIMRNVLHALGLSSDESGSSVVDTDEEEDRQRRERIRQTRRMSMPVTAMAARSQAQSGQQQQQQQEWSQGLRIQLADNNVSNGSGNGPRRSSRQWTRVLGGLLSGGGHGHGGSQQGSSTSENNSNGGSLPAISTVSPMAS